MSTTTDRLQITLPEEGAANAVPLTAAALQRLELATAGWSTVAFLVDQDFLVTLDSASAYAKMVRVIDPPANLTQVRAVIFPKPTGGDKIIRNLTAQPIVVRYSAGETVTVPANATQRVFLTGQDVFAV